MPVLAWQALVFSSPGLLPKERIWMRRLLLYIPIIGGITIVSTLLYGLPSLFSWGHQLNVAEGLETRYDASELLRVAFTIAWLEALLILAVCSVVFGGIIGLITRHTVSWWRIRVHGFTLGIMWLMLPESLAGARISILAFTAICIECSLIPFAHREGFRMNLSPGRGILDSEGCLRRICFVDCRCAGACPQMSSKNLPTGSGSFSAKALCLSAEERDHLLEKMRDERYTDVIISGCDGTPLPFQFRDSLNILDINLGGLQLIDSRSYRTQESNLLSADIDLAVASMIDPWPLDKIRDRQFTALSSNNLPNRILFSQSTGKMPWGSQISENELFIPGKGPIGEKIVEFSLSNNIEITNIDGSI
tara:strand:- start:116 stop:1204 length:1089 start_codon:yes stop_codon:yes gene_type:complete